MNWKRCRKEMVDAVSLPIPSVKGTMVSRLNPTGLYKDYVYSSVLLYEENSWPFKVKKKLQAVKYFKDRCLLLKQELILQKYTGEINTY